MKNIVVITGDDSLIIKNHLDNIILKEKIVEEEIYRYDLENIPLRQIIEELDTYNFLTSRKVIIVNNAKILTNEQSVVSDEEIEDLIKYINNPKEENILIFTCSKLSSKRKIAKVLKEKALIISDEINLLQYIKDNLEDYKMDNITINYLVTYCNNDFGKIKNELEKLKLYKLTDKVILKEDINKIVIKALDDSDTYLFSLINNIVLLNKEKSLEIYGDLLKLSIEPMHLLSMIANQIRLILQSKILKEEGYNNDDIAKKLDVHPYRVKKALENYQLKKKTLEKYLLKLSEIDLKIKTGEVQPDIALKLFILGM